MRKLVIAALLFAFACSNYTQSLAEHIAGLPYRRVRVLYVIDGDTYDVCTDGCTGFCTQKERIRVAGIDAPECWNKYDKVPSQPYAKEAKKKLEQLLPKNTNVNIAIEQPKDKYGRTVAWTILQNGTNVSVEMIRVGMAWHYAYKANFSELARMEQNARVARRGLWQGRSPERPNNYRKRTKEVRYEHY